LGKNGPNNQNPEDLPRFYKIAQKMKILSKIVKKWPKIDKKWPKNPIFPDFRKMPKIVDFPKIGSNK